MSETSTQQKRQLEKERQVRQAKLQNEDELFLISAIDDDGDSEKVVTCEYSDTNWEPLETTLYTCDIMTQTINSPGFKIKFEPGNTERVEGLRFIDNINLNFLPDNIAEIFPNLKAISGSKSYLNSISNTDFKGLSKLKYLNLANTDLKVIEEETFTDLIELEELDISDCDIRYIDEDAFRGLSSLKTLYIGANKLSSLEPKTFEGLSSLTSLSMELNHLEHIDDNLFITNENLADIWMNNNSIVSMNWKVFENVPKLTYVDLQSNPCIDGVYDESNFDELKETLTEKCASSFIVRKIHEKSKNIMDVIKNVDESVRTEFNIDGDIKKGKDNVAQVVNFIKSNVFDLFGRKKNGEQISVEFKNDPATKTVECSFNSLPWKLSEVELETCDIENQIIDAKGFKIVSADDGVERSNLKAISFAQNKNIKFLPENIGKFAPNLVEFSARNASLQVLSKKNFAGLKNLRSLNLADNKIKHIDPDAFDDLSSLEELDLSGNELEILDEDVFAKLKNLKTLRIGNNKFHSIHHNLFKNLRNLVNVSISNQHIEKIPEKLFNTNLKLQNIWMNSNKIKSISPNMFAKLKDLEYIDIRDNKCIDTYYDATKFRTMKEEILEKCGAGYKLNKGVKVENVTTSKKKGKDKKSKKKEKLPKVSRPDSSVEEKEVTCEYEDIFWPNVNKTLRTCVIKEAIDDENYFLNADIMQFDDFSDIAGIQAISFENNKNAKFLPKNIGEVFPNLIEFSAANSGLTSLNPESFKGLKKLKLLNLSNNEITSLDPEVFKELTSLEELFVDDNEIEEIEEEVFTYFKVLKKLKMKGNKLKTIEESWFEEMPELHDVSFDISQSVHVDSQMFNKNPKLKFIKMNNEFYDSNMTPIDGSSLSEYEPEEIIDEETIIETAPETVEIQEISCQINEDTPEICEIDSTQIIDSINYVIKPSPQNEYIQEFVIKNNPHVKFLPQNLGLSFPNLKKIHIQNSPLSTINQKVFENMPNLRSINFVGTNIKSFESDTFNDLPQLEELDLSENPIEIIEEGAFDKLRELKKLNLGKNELHFIHPKIFKFLKNLQSLSLSGNKLTVLDPTIFKNNPELEIIELEGNPIRHLSPKMFDRLKKLNKINFTGTHCIDGTFDFRQLEDLKKTISENCEPSSKTSNKEIYCDFRELLPPHEESTDTCIIDEDQIIDESDFKISIDASNIDPLEVKTLSISNNDKIKFFPENIGYVFPNLKNFYATNNSLNDIPDGIFTNMTNLETLNLSKNKFKNFNPMTFDGLSWLESLDLSDNDIEEIDEIFFAKLPKLKKINISGNQIRTINPKAFEKLPFLEEITIDEIEGLNFDDFDINDNVKIITKRQKQLPERDYEEDKSEEKVKLETDSDEITSEKPVEKISEVESESKSEEEIENPIREENIETNTVFEEPEIKPNILEEIETKIKEPEIVDGDSTSYEEKSGELDFDEIPATSTSKAEINNEVVCDVETIEMVINGMTEDILSCVISNQPINEDNYKIKTTDYDPEIKSVKIENNEDVKFLPNNIGELFPNLISLSAKNNSITSLPQDILKNLNNLKILDLSNNDIKHLDSEMLNDAPVLEEINLSGNKIRELPEEFFTYSPLIKNLNLKHNEISDISPIVFEKLPNLSELIIDDGNLSPELDVVLQKNNPHLNIETLLPQVSTITTTSTTTESSSIIHTVAPSVESTTKGRPVSATRSTTRRRIVSTFTTTTTTTTPRSETVRQIKCEIIYEPSDFLSKNVMKCDISNQEIDDPEASLLEIPNGAEIEALKLDNNKNIKYLPENIAQVMPNLIEVSAKNSAIDSILPGDFEDLKRLENIDLSGNELKAIEPENFDGLIKLKKLDLSDNEIEFIDEDAFNLPQLTDLDLDNNEITFLHPKIFRNLPNLQVLNIDGNNIPHLHEEIFSGNPKLKDVKHSVKNFIMPTFTTTTKSPVRILTTFSKQIPTQRPQAFTTTRKYSQVDFRTTTPRSFPQTQKEIECEYGNIHWTFSDEELFTCDLKDAVIDEPNYIIKQSPRNKRVKGLSFVDNKNVKFLPKNIASEFPNLVEISAFNTSINSVPNGVLNNLPKLKNLQLMSSDISSVDPQAFHNLPSLESLDMSNNNLYDLPSDSFKSVSSLKSLYIANNNLRQLDPKIFENIPDLRNISLENNKLPTIDKKLFGKNYELQNIWLNGNQINSIDPTIFDGKRALEYVDLRGNDCINEFFESYGIEGIRNKLKNSCKSTEEANFVPRTTSRAKEVTFETTIKPRPMYTTDRSVTKIKMTTTRRPIENFGSKGPQSFISSTQRPSTVSTTTPSSINEVKCTLSYHEFPDAPNPLYSCFIIDQPIDSNGFTVKTTPYNNFVEGFVIDDNNNVKHLPENIGRLFPNLEYLSARNNSINDVPRDVLDGLQKLKNLDLSDNNLSVIDRETFTNLPSLEELNLSGNNVPHIYNETFGYLPTLKELDLSRNEIDTIDTGVFNSMPSLEKLSLENNEIIELPENLFKKNPKLESVNLSGNKISSLHPEIFENLPMLKEVNLDENNCIDGHYKGGAFYAMKHDIRRNCQPENYISSSIDQSLEETTRSPITTTATEDSRINLIETSAVDCEFSDTYSPSTEDYLTSCIVNKDKNIEDPKDWEIKKTPSNKRVKRFVVDGNKNVEKMPKNLGESFPELNELIVTNVPLKTLSPDDFKDLKKLQTATISNTSIKDIDPDTFSGAPNLQNLILSNNNLRHIDDDSFNGIPKLKSLDLSGNKIQKLSNEIFKNLPQLNEIKLNGNDLHSIDGELFKKNPKLYKINLDENNLKTIDPSAFDRLPQLINLDLSKNECIDRSFGTSTMHLMRKIVNENCLPYKTLKNELRACKKEVESCRLSPKINEVRTNGDEGFRDSLQKAETKIRQLNLQINKLRNALKDEKNLLGKEIEKSRNLQIKLDQMMHKCARIDDNHNFLIDLNCEFHEDDNKFSYSCFVRNLKIATENATIDNIKGEHKPGKSKYDVDSLIITNQNMRFLPNDISNQFPYLKELIVDNSKLTNVNKAPFKNLPHLTKLVIKGHDIENISPYAFENIPQLEELDLSKNNLRELPFGIFEKLPNLKTLNLNDNALLSLPHDIIPKMNNLKKFMVNRNNLNSIDPRLLPKLKNAEVIDLSNNKCIDEKFDANVDDKNISFMAFIGEVNMKCINNDDDENENGFCKGRKAQ
ncbi:hypothetical protein PVAND_013461 [Polypedilum vanderplanki]|uniref:Leucine-rich repeat-containing protein n=1 Tax=Polypedilum vanderplanki TaxID=319348 RepID=A0A9J6CQS0_POLVA|nr:hypothetical protein PVAND_013461 [Polypedilum vanderplanki]